MESDKTITYKIDIRIVIIEIQDNSYKVNKHVLNV